MAFLALLRHAYRMDKDEHAERLRIAMAERRIGRTAIADHLEVNVRTVTNWSRGKTMPSAEDVVKLREILGADYDAPGDAVDLAVRRSPLTEDRQLAVLAFYRRQLREQDEEQTTRMGA